MAKPAWAETLHRQTGPLYRQAAGHLRAAILGGRLKVGAPLPTEAELAEAFGISLITIRAALRDLEGEGLIRKRAAKTAIVVRAEPRPAQAAAGNGLGGLITALEGAALRVGSFRPMRSAEAARLFGLDGRSMIACLRGTLHRAADALGEVTMFYAPALGARLSRADFDALAGYPGMAERLGMRVGGARLHFAATSADAELAGELGCAAGAPVVSSRAVCLDAGGVPVEAMFARFRGDRFSLEFEVIQA